MTFTTNQTPMLVPPFTLDSAIAKVRLAEDGWNSRLPEVVALACTRNSCWRNRNEILRGQEQILLFLNNKWQKELDYRLIQELWTFSENRIAVRFAYEWRDSSQNWTRSCGNENWAFEYSGLMTHRFASINDIAIAESDRLFHWPLGPRPEEHMSLGDVCLGDQGL